MSERLRIVVLAMMAAVIMMAVSMVWVNPAHAATTITVSTTTDELTVNGNCSLREAIQNFNNAKYTYPECGPTGTVLNDLLGLPVTVTINVPAGTYDLTIAGTSMPMVIWMLPAPVR